MYGLATLILRSPLAVINRKNKKQVGEELQANFSRNHPKTQPDPEKDGANGTSLDNGTVRTRNESGKRFLRSDIVGDGSCLFRAISVFLYGSQDQHQQIRMNTTNYIHDNWSALKIYVVENDQNNNPTAECTIIKSISHSQELNEDDAVPMLGLEKSISNLNAVIRNNVKTVGDFKALKKIVASIERTLKTIQESKTRKHSLLTNEKPKPGAVPKIIPQRHNPLLFSTKNKKAKNRQKEKC
ncbi:unnamed protein product [Ceutorhynchus assimilis]|uniref:OTU domain-containing protein n=1 Tax=Ceutorhynchus assimilis TaxID=467358 RepID=A0A9N9MDT7_9CUCU|nr:unnamed protein product [Ceutorhynchus assimilis]